MSKIDYLFVTSFSGQGFVDYGQKMVDSFKSKFPEGAGLMVYYHDPLDTDQAALFESNGFVSLHGVSAHEDFYSQPGLPDGKLPVPDQPEQFGYNFRYDIKKFAHKVFAFGDAMFRANQMPERPKWLIWLDADVEAKGEKIPETFFPLLFEPANDADIVWLERVNMPYVESSFVGLPVNDKTAKFMFNYTMEFNPNSLRHYAEWHDGYVLTQYVKAKGLKTYNLTSPGYTGIDAFMNSPLGVYLFHAKGPAKEMQVPATKAKPGGAAIRVVPQDCVENPELLANCEFNEKHITKWLKQGMRNNATLICVSGGPSLKKEIENLKGLIRYLDSAQEDYAIVCVKHVHNYLIENGIIPTACVLLDPRPMEGTSTTGHKRQDLLANPHPDVIYLVASMTHRDWVPHLQKHNAKIVGWDAMTTGLKDRKLPEGRFYVTGGTCSAMRMIGIGHVLGFRNFELFGYDACLEEEPKPPIPLDEKGRPQYFKIKVDNNETGAEFWTSGEWIALFQDVEQLIKEIAQGKLDITLGIHGSGMVKYTYDKHAKLLSKPTWEEILNV